MIEIRVRLIRVGDIGAVVIPLTDAILIIEVISTNPTQGALQDQESEGGLCRDRPVVSHPGAIISLLLDESVGEIGVPVVGLLRETQGCHISLSSNIILKNPRVSVVGRNL